MNQQQKHHALFVSALKEAVRQYPRYFYVTGKIDEIDSMWDLQPQYNMLENLLLEDDATQHFIISIWSFFQPISLGNGSLAEMTRCLHPWQKSVLAQLIIHDPLSDEVDATLNHPEDTTEE